MKSNKEEQVTYKVLYDFVDRKMENINERLSAIEKQLSNMEGRAAMIPFLVSSGIGVFFTIINFVLSRLPK